MSEGNDKPMDAEAEPGQSAPATQSSGPETSPEGSPARQPRQPDTGHVLHGRPTRRQLLLQSPSAPVGPLADAMADSLGVRRPARPLPEPGNAQQPPPALRRTRSSQQALWSPHPGGEPPTSPRSPFSNAGAQTASPDPPSARTVQQQPWEFLDADSPVGIQQLARAWPFDPEGEDPEPAPVPPPEPGHIGPSSAQTTPQGQQGHATAGTSDYLRSLQHTQQHGQPAPETHTPPSQTHAYTHGHTPPDTHPPSDYATPDAYALTRHLYQGLPPAKANVYVRGHTSPPLRGYRTPDLQRSPSQTRARSQTDAPDPESPSRRARLSHVSPPPSTRQQPRLFDPERDTMDFEQHQQHAGHFVRTTQQLQQPSPQPEQRLGHFAHGQQQQQQQPGWHPDQRLYVSQLHQALQEQQQPGPQPDQRVYASQLHQALQQQQQPSLQPDQRLYTARLHQTQQQLPGPQPGQRLFTAQPHQAQQQLSTWQPEQRLYPSQTHRAQQQLPIPSPDPSLIALRPTVLLPHHAQQQPIPRPDQGMLVPRTTLPQPSHFPPPRVYGTPFLRPTPGPNVPNVVMNPATG